MDGAGEVFGARLKLHRGDRLGDKLRRLRAEDVDAEDLVRLLVGDDLTNPVVSPAAIARPEAANGNVPARHAVPALSSSASVRPTHAISGWV